METNRQTTTAGPLCRHSGQPLKRREDLHEAIRKDVAAGCLVLLLAACQPEKEAAEQSKEPEQTLESQIPYLDTAQVMAPWRGGAGTGPEVELPMQEEQEQRAIQLLKQIPLEEFEPCEWGEVTGIAQELVLRDGEGDDVLHGFDRRPQRCRPAAHPVQLSPTRDPGGHTDAGRWLPTELSGGQHSFSFTELKKLCDEVYNDSQDPAFSGQAALLAQPEKSRALTKGNIAGIQTALEQAAGQGGEGEYDLALTLPGGTYWLDTRSGTFAQQDGNLAGQLDAQALQNVLRYSGYGAWSE